MSLTSEADLCKRRCLCKDGARGPKLPGRKRPVTELRLTKFEWLNKVFKDPSSCPKDGNVGHEGDTV